jgi:NTE family protein
MRGTPSFFEGVSTDAVEASLAGLARRRFGAGSVVLAAGDSPGEMYVLREGTAEVVLAGRGGTEHVVGHVRVGETIGEMSLLTGDAASATVRAAEDVEVIVLQAGQLEALIERLPQLQRNIIATLSARLARATQLAFQEELGQVVILEDGAGAHVLGRALAASLAWHTRCPTLHLVLGAPSSRLSTQATAARELPIRPTPPGADFVVSNLEGPFAPDRIAATFDELVRSFDHVLVQVPRGWAGLPEMHPRARLRLLDSPASGFAVTSVDRVESHDRVIPVPALEARDTAWLEHGLLPSESPAGSAIGRLARQLAGLRVGIALGAGSLRGYAHVGALRALERHGVPIDCLAGTSIGATVAGGYAHFGSAERVTEFLDGLGERMFRPTLSRKSLLSTRAMRRYIRKVVGDPLLEDLPIPLGVVATDVDTHDEVVLRRGSSVTAMFASGAVPGVFPAVRIGSRTLVDGGIVNPVPLAVAASLGADVVIGIRLVHGGGTRAEQLSEEGEGPVPSAIAAIMRSIEVLQTRVVTDSGSVPTIVLTPEFGSIPAAKLRNFRDGRRYIAAGEAAVEAALPRLRGALPWLRPLDRATEGLPASDPGRASAASLAGAVAPD